MSERNFAGAKRASVRAWLLATTVIGPAALGASASAQSVTPAAGPTVEGVVVTARRTTIDPLTMKRDSVAEMSVISADEIAARPVANVVDALSILPGVSTFVDNGLGQATTGNPEFVTIRGLDSSYNAYQLNGVRVPTADPYTRALSLKQLPPFGLQAVQVIKAPTADYVGDSIGGVVDIHTPDAFDYTAPLTKITLQGNLNDLADSTGFDSTGGAVQFEFARKFDGDKLGVYFTGYYQRANSTAETTEVNHYAPTLAAESQISNYNNVSSLTADQFRWDFYTHQISTYGGNISLDYRDGGQALYFKMTASQYDDQSTDNQTSLRHGTANSGKNAVGQVVDYYGRPVGQGLPGDPAYAPQQTNLNASGTSYDANGVYDPNGVLPGHYFQLRDEVDSLTTVKLGGSSEFDRVKVAYELSYGYNVAREPNYVQGSSYTLPDATGRFIINSTAGGTPNISYGSAATQAFLFSQSSDRLWKFQGADAGSEESLYGGKIDLDYQVDAGPLKVIHAGIDISRSERIAWNHQFTGSGGDNFDILTPQGYLAPYYNPAGPTVANQVGQNVQGSFLGYNGIFRVASRGGYINAILPYAYQSLYAATPQGGVTGNPGVYTANDYNGGSFGGTEDIDAGYVSADFQWRSLHVYPGLRFEHTDYHGYFWNYDGLYLGSGNTAGEFQHLSGSSDEVLPNLNLVYRADDGFVFRGSLRKSFSRPAFGLLAGPAGYSYDQTGAVTNISEGNPNLKPTEAIDADGSVEYYGTKDVFLDASFYYKDLSNFIYTSNVTGSGAQASGGSNTIGGIVYSQPQNGKSGHVAGMELSATDRFSFLPGPWRGLGVNVNTTLQHSEAESGMAGQGVTPLPHAPKIIYNLQLLYDLRGAHAALSYQYQGLQLYNLQGNLLNEYLQPTSFLNLTVGYELKGWDLTFGARNLTDGYVFYKTLGESKKYLGVQDGGGNGAYIRTGRVYQLTGSYKF